jgi:hypothetical protein
MGRPRDRIKAVPVEGRVHDEVSVVVLKPAGDAYGPREAVYGERQRQDRDERGQHPEPLSPLAA